MNNVFIPVVGQFSNVGDILHRRELVTWLKDDFNLYVYVGEAPTSFIEALGLNENCRVYTNIFKWLLALVISPLNRTHFIFNPGEMRMAFKRALGEFCLLPFILLVRLKKGEVVRAGVAIMSDSPKKWLTVFKFFVGLSTQVYWRTAKSRDTFGFGLVAPDLAYYDYNSSENIENKNIISISLRGNRPYPAKEWFEAVKKIAQDYDLNIVTVSQVRMDNAAAIYVAEKLNCKAVIWKENDSHLTQKEKLENIYKKSILTISDRLHVLIYAHTKYSFPVNTISVNSNKVNDHMEVVGLNNLTLFLDSQTEQEIFEYIEHIKNQKIADHALILKKAKSELEVVRTKIVSSLF